MLVKLIATAELKDTVELYLVPENEEDKRLNEKINRDNYSYDHLFITADENIKESLMSGNNKEYVDKLNFLDGIAVDILKKFDGLTVGDAKDILSLVESNVDCIGKLECKGEAFDKLVSEHFFS